MSVELIKFCYNRLLLITFFTQKNKVRKSDQKIYFAFYLSCFSQVYYSVLIAANTICMISDNLSILLLTMAAVAMW